MNKLKMEGFQSNTKFLHTFKVCAQYVCMYMCMYIHVCIHVYIHVYIHTCHISQPPLVLKRWSRQRNDRTFIPNVN